MPGHASRKSSFRLQQPAAGDQSPLYIYRPKASTPGLSKPLRLSYPEVFVDDRSVGSISCHRYLQIELEPGQHELRMTGLTGGARGRETRDIVRTLEIPAGRSSFPCCQVEYDLQSMNVMQPKAQYHIMLSPVREENAIYEIRHTKPSK